ncbi:hypothetical protein [Mycobacterium sp. AZCC_0083]|uniref:hypothetical protein n=1 Tax=Mycobacterium sp. AZCC_0083 TaxID=2735882 RepID=UPI00160AFE22|nr:hypothetical protein [Mycobacterium sp. AZCC_0083]
MTVLLFRGSTRWRFEFVPGTFTGGGVRIGAAAAAAGILILLTVALCAAAGITMPVTAGAASFSPRSVPGRARSPPVSWSD